MKTLISLVTLITIAATYILSANLYLQGQFFFAYFLVGSFVVSLTFWIRSNDVLRSFSKNA